MNSNFIGYVEGYICTTDIDLHGDRFAPEAIDRIKEQIEQNISLRTVYLEHDISQPCGEILNLRVEKREGWKGLWVKVGIYKDREDVWEKIEKKELKGFSLAGKVLEFQRFKNVGEEAAYKFDLEVDSSLKWEIKEILDKEGVKSEVYIRKAWDIPTIISVTTNALVIVDILHKYWINRKKQGQNITLNIVIGKQKFTFDQSSPDDIKRHLETK